MTDRRFVSKALETEVLMACRRRCCLCVFLADRQDVRKGQLAHLNRDPADARFENLVWLCLEHHDEYDSRTSQSKGLTQAEVRTYRNRLYAQFSDADETRSPQLIEPLQAIDEAAAESVSVYDALRKTFEWLQFTSVPWRYPLWQVANEPELFAYKAGNRADGICLIERVDIPDGRIVIACIEVPGNPGQSITNSVEELCFQVCERFEIPPARLVWLEHYSYYEPEEWEMVTFKQIPPDGPFTDPEWTTMTPALWGSLQLKPKKRLLHSRGSYDSKLIKRFDWPTRAMLS
jgi:hypothetical protein